MKNVGKIILNNKFVVGLGALTLVYFFVVKPMLNKNKDSTPPFDINKFKPVESKLTISSAEAAKLANDMYVEMKGINLSYDLNLWYNVLNKVSNKDDAILVAQAFGTKDKENLLQWIKSEWGLKHDYPTLYQNLINLFSFSLQTIKND